MNEPALTSPSASVHLIALTAPTVTLPGQTGQLFAIAAADQRIVDVRAETPNASVQRILAGISDVRLPEGGTWAEVLSVQDLRVLGGQYVNVIIRNDGDAPARLRASVRVIAERSPASAADQGSVRSAPKSPPTEITEHGEPVTFLLGRGLAPYVVMFLQGGAVPRQMHSAILASFEDARMVRTAASRPMPTATQDVEVTLGEHVRKEIGRAVRFRSPPRMSMADRATAAEAISLALQPPIAKPPSSVMPDQIEAVNSHHLSAQDMRIETLEKALATAAERLMVAQDRIVELERMIDDAAPDSSNVVEAAS